MARRPAKVKETPAGQYDAHGVLDGLDERPVEFALDEELRQQIISGRRTRRLENVSIKLDAAQIMALRKIATTKSLPWQTLIRMWLAEGIRRELRLGPAQRR